ncbi:hypothetical protein Csp1_12210 [Corynebacterium provencense]|uniref:Mycothiol-dependent maleylpyruvate isomerase metal-binding domain-containing protein n=1 Tax=Corynebacterium provencense TaxID=1737425 RepID=A0A2Z3YQS0_9CORY|nr:TIGR03085 family metal-binding protein [Corynebacterium provencense]AWT26021.1 hypothetical protein Csp1_12210 [Corynebacterium provencense]
MSFSRDERVALADLLLSVGPDAPTLCEGWSTRDLVVHLVLREYRPDAAAGMFFSPVEGRLRSVTRSYRELPYPELVERYRGGPPPWNPMRLLDPVVNFTENFIHHEDVRRGGGEWSLRDLGAGERDALWKAVRLSARGFIVPSGPAVRFGRTDGPAGAVEELTVGSGGPQVGVTGPASELLLWIFGRDKACDVTVTGPVERVVRRSL